MNDASVGVTPTPELYRRRVRFEWTLVCVIAVGGAVVAVASWMPLPVDAVTLFFGLLAVALFAGGSVLAAFLFRTLPPSAHITRSADLDVAEAAKKVRRGEPVHPPELQADAITSVRSAVRTCLLTVSFQPVLATSWTLRAGPAGLGGVLNVVGPIVILLVLAALSWFGVLQHRLDTLERHTVPAPTGPPPASSPTAPCQDPDASETPSSS